ncbi:hypothetical protein MmTuc01_3359 [Methanosarcina mazei Tuc01]|uniref:Uncharacterized protein n=1 Tax=Methanosarcina mazei Tuc01 TaxID=1236903 RepID=M1QED6_METMZ|nr:hypothetical protein MmTuc01_3359 [Methanosarcina mazei Tuc01]
MIESRINKKTSRNDYIYVKIFNCNEKSRTKQAIPYLP